MTNTKAEFTADDIARITENLAFIAANPTGIRQYWIDGVHAEARAAGLMPAKRRGFDPIAAHWEERILIRQENEGVGAL